MASSSGSGQVPQRQLSRSQTMGYVGDPVKDSELVPSCLSEITPILRVANEVEPTDPRVAYLCRFYAYEKANRLDPESSGRGVRQFKTALRQRLEKESDPSLAGKVRDSDAQSMRSFYKQYYRDYIQARQNVVDKADRARLTEAYQTATVLFEVLKAVILTNSSSLEVDHEILEKHKTVEEKTKTYVPYNILPLDPASADQAIMQYPEIKVAVIALRDIRGLPWPKDHIHKADVDILDWLGVMFAFQKDNVSNQREHLILLLANVHVRICPKPDNQPKLDESALNDVMKKLFKNYKKWCKYLNRKSSLWLPAVPHEVQQRKLLYMGLYLLIWGEAANLRFMPECLCYIYHHMAFELYEMLAGNVNPVTGEYIKPAYSGDDEAFLKKVVTPIYNTIAKEAERSKKEKSKHSQWRNYDDLNEYFWSVDCFHLSWPMRPDADFFCHAVNSFSERNNDDGKKPRIDRWIGKVNFVEVRSYWHIFRSFDRMWSFFVLALQAMIILAWNGGSPIDILDFNMFKKVLSIFITTAMMKLGKAVLDIVLSWKARRSMSFPVKLRYVLKFAFACVWVIILSVTYAYMWDSPNGLSKTIRSWFGNGGSQPSLYLVAVIIYETPDVLSLLLFLFPWLRRFVERSNYRIVRLLMWWSQPHLFVGRGLHESTLSFIMYTLFWVVLLFAKLAFSYYLEVRPLVGPTKYIMQNPITTFEWHEFFPRAKNNIGVVIALWAPVVLVYFMDAQIWYAIFLTALGGIYGAYRRLGEIRTLGMLRSRFQSLPSAFNARLVPKENSNSRKKGLRASISRKFAQMPAVDKERQAARFAQMWNKIITSFRKEDLINDREMDLLLVPYCADRDVDLIQWPPFLLASKIPIALHMAEESNGRDRELRKRLEADIYMNAAVRECYASLKSIIKYLVVGEVETSVINDIFEQVDEHINTNKLIADFNMRALPDLYNHFVKLIEYLMKNKEEDREQVILLFQDMHEVVSKDIIMEDLQNFQETSYGNPHIGPGARGLLFASPGAIRFPVPNTDAWREKIKRLFLLLTVKESAMDVPTNLEARRRILFFSNSLFMDMPDAPEVRNMLSFSVLTPYYNEDVLFSLQNLEEQNEDGVSIIFYLQKIYPDEWGNFLERVSEEKLCGKSELEDERGQTLSRTDEWGNFLERLSEEKLCGKSELEDELRLWASHRGQTLSRTVRGMMYYRKALELQAFLDMAEADDLLEGYRAAELMSEEQSEPEKLLWRQCQAIADMKFTYVVSCQQYGIHKQSGDPRAQDILKLLTTYPALRVAYIDEIEEPNEDKKIEKVYYSVLVKAAISKATSSDGVLQNLDQVIYRIKLPGPAIIGEGKPENQNHAVIFTRGEGLQTIDMNQDNYMEEALKMRNLLQEFLKKHDRLRYPSILGVREHIFTSSVSSLAWFMSNQETSSVTIGQRVLANPLRVRFHYGHPDVFDRVFHLTRGGVSKASKIINLSDGIFAGFNSILREGSVTHHEYLQVGKGRDVGLNQISLFEAKIANGNGEQTLSRDMYRLGHRFDFFRMLSCYYTTVGFYFSTLVTVLTVYVFLYGRLYLELSGLEEGLTMGRKFVHNKPLQVALASQSFVQLGFLLALPMMIEIGLERGFQTALSEFVLMQLQLASVFFTFSLGTKTHYFGRTLLHGGAEYRATGRGFVVFHAKFADNYRLYSRSHFVKGIELLILLVIYQVFGQTYRSSVAYIFITITMWFMVGTWLFAPFLFNPSGFEWQKIVDDWIDWNKWISNRGGIGVSPGKSWESWWEREQEHLRYTGKCGVLVEILLASRFLVFQYGLVYHLNITKKTRNISVYGASWLVILAVLLVMKTVSVGRRRFSAKFQLVFRLFKFLIFVTSVSILITLIALPHMTVLDIVVCVLAFMPTGWGLLLIAQACRPIVKWAGLWGSVRALARGYEIVMGLILFTPIAFFAWFPFVSEFQTRMLFNQAFSRGLQISRILGGHRKDRTSRTKE